MIELTSASAGSTSWRYSAGISSRQVAGKLVVRIDEERPTAEWEVATVFCREIMQQRLVRKGCYPPGSASTNANFRIARHPGIQCFLIPSTELIPVQAALCGRSCLRLLLEEIVSTNLNFGEQTVAEVGSPGKNGDRHESSR
jgi:hypothetical protein